MAGRKFSEGFKAGAIGGGVATAINIPILGPAIIPTGKAKEALDRMGADLKIKLTGPYGPTYRSGGIWQRGLTVGKSANINNGNGLDDPGTWVHEYYHYYQQLTQSWPVQFKNGIYEQWYLDFHKKY